MKRLTLLSFAAVLVGYVAAQVPGFGWCPDYSPMSDFDLDRYTGLWYEAERYFTVFEAGSRCVRSNYTKGGDGKFRVANEITNRLTGIRRVLDGTVQNIGKGGEGKITVKYYSLPVPFDTQYSVLDTDYDTYSVVWSCNSLGPLNTQNAWVMTRDRNPPGSVLQQAYGVLDKHKISRTFFVKTDQNDCLFPDDAPVTHEEEGDKDKETSNKVQSPEGNGSKKEKTAVPEPGTMDVKTSESHPVLQHDQNSEPKTEKVEKPEGVEKEKPVQTSH